jgi:hypothetical protein
MLKKSPKRIGEMLSFTVGFDPSDRSVPVPVPLKKALATNKDAKKVFDSLPPSRQKEIARYIAKPEDRRKRGKECSQSDGFSPWQKSFCGKG